MFSSTSYSLSSLAENPEGSHGYMKGDTKRSKHSKHLSNSLLEAGNEHEAAQESDNVAAEWLAIAKVGEEAAYLDHDAQGKLCRRIYLEEQRYNDLMKEAEETEIRCYAEVREARTEVKRERAVAVGLRERIGKLEEKVRKGRDELQMSRKELGDLSREMLLVESSCRDEVQRMNIEGCDLREALDKERKETSKLKEENRVLAEKLSEVEKINEKLERAHHTRSPLSILSLVDSNTTNPTPQYPVTPTKKTTISDAKSPIPRLSQDAATTPTTSLARRYVNLEDRHKSLKAAYDKLRKSYSDDIKHWKEYKAVEIARSQLKKTKKERKRLAKLGRESQASQERTETVLDKTDVIVEASDNVVIKVNEDQDPPSGGERRPIASSGTTVGGPGIIDVASHNDDDDDFEELIASSGGSSLEPVVLLPKSIHKSIVTPQAQKYPASHQDPTLTPKLDNQSNHGGQAAVSAYQATTPLSEFCTPGPTAKTTVLSRESKDHLAQATKVTPWLGSSSTKHRRDDKNYTKQDSFEDDDDYRRPVSDDLTTPKPNAIASGSKATLIRDRTGRTVDANLSLRRAALQKTVTGEGDIRTPDLRDTGSPVPSSSKRKLIELEGLTPSEKAKQLKRLGKLPAWEKREIYAAYKGNGRYLAPEDLRSKAEDEFEINPEMNDGHSFQYHDVQRKREERKKMHGGDCECCKEYYTSIGQIPRYNPGLAWKDPPQHDIDGDMEAAADARQHQNKVSRHRETWMKPPTPPGYWQIGFPTTQAVLAQNIKADQMAAEKDAQIRRDAAHKDSKWRKKA